MSGFRTVALAAGAAIATAFTISAIKSFAESLADAVLEGAKTAAEMGNMAQKAGVAVDTFSRLSYAAQLSDISNEELLKGFKGLSQEMAKTGKGGQAVEEELLRIADTFADSADGANKTAEAVRLFGKSGQSMIPLLNQGSAALREQMHEADQLGVTIGPDFARDANEFENNLKRLKAASEAFKLEMAKGAIPTMNSLIAGLVELTKQAGGGGAIFDALKNAVGAVIPALGAQLALLESIGRQAEKNAEIKPKENNIVNPDDVEKALKMLEKIELARKRGATAIRDQIKFELDNELEAISKLQIADQDKEDLRVAARLEAEEKITDIIKQGELERAQLDEFYRNGETQNYIKSLQDQYTSKLAWLEAQKGLMDTYRDLWSLSFQNLGNAFTTFATGALRSFSEGFGNAIASIATGAMTAQEAFTQLGKSMLAMLVKFAAQLVINSLLAAVIQKSIAASTIATITPIASAWGVAAFLAAVATEGEALAAGALVGPLAAAAGLESGAIALAAGGGALHGGLDYVPDETTYLLQRGERVVSRDNNAELMDYMRGDNNSVASTEVYRAEIDGFPLFELIREASRDGRITIHSRAIAT